MTNILNKFVLDRLFADAVTSINVQAGSVGATGDIETKNSYPMININKKMLIPSIELLHKNQVSLEYMSML